MRKRRLGSQGLEVAELGLGCMNVSVGAAAALADENRIAVIERAAELGVTLFDTAEAYGPFANEIVVGKALGKVRERVVIATKFGFDIKPGEGRPQGLNSRPEHIREVCDASLQRLGVDTIDLFFQHRVDPAVPIEEVAGAVGDLVAAGKVRWFGLSEASPATLRRAHAVHPVSALQSELSLFTREAEEHVLPACRELGIGFVAYSPLGRGFLGGAGGTLAEGDHRQANPRWQGEALANNLALFAQLEALAKSRGATPAQISLAWLLHQGEDIVPIPGTSKRHRLEENVAATEIRLTPDELAAIEQTMPAEAVTGDRTDPFSMTMLDR